MSNDKRRSTPTPISISGLPLGSKVHQLKCWPIPFAHIRDGSKTFEYRENDRFFLTDDVLVLHEYDPRSHPDFAYSGEYAVRSVPFMLEGGNFGVPNAFVIMSLAEAEGITLTCEDVTREELVSADTNPQKENPLSEIPNQQDVKEK